MTWDPSNWRRGVCISDGCNLDEGIGHCVEVCHDIECIGYVEWDDEARRLLLFVPVS